jgi:hypothetical protein
MSLCSELENINISINYYNFIKEVFDDYIQFITNYKTITNEYLKKLSSLQEKFSYKLSTRDKENMKYKNINIEHIFSLTSPIPKIIKEQIENSNICIKGIETQIENYNKLMKEKEILSNKIQLMFEESRKDLLKKYREIDKLKENFRLSMANTEDIIFKCLSQKDKTITEDRMKWAIDDSKKIEKDYKNLINSTKLYEETFDSIYLSSLENMKKLCSETSNQMKDLIIDFIILLKNNVKMQMSQIDMYLPELGQLDEVKIIENIIINSYRKNNKLVHVKPQKYRMKIFKNKIEEDELGQSTNPIVNLEDGFEEMMLIRDENIVKTLKIMKENFELFEDKNISIEIEEEKVKCMLLIEKILNVENPKTTKKSKDLVSDDDINELNNLIDKHHNRVVFLQKLSEFRNVGKFEIGKNTFEILSKLFNTLINTIERDVDYHSAKNAIILSQTYYMKDEKNNDKIYLQKNIQNKEIFRSKKFWEEFLDFSINKEIVQCVSNDVKNGNILKENRKEAEDKMSNIAFAQIVPYTDNMREFGLDKETIKELVFPKMEKYKMNKELIEQVKDVIDNH